jgi:hypothetical protein
MNDDAITAEPANEDDNSAEEEDDEDNEDGSDSDGEDSFSDLASSNDEEEEQEEMETKPKSVEEKVDGQNKKKKAGEIPFVFKGNLFCVAIY